MLLDFIREEKEAYSEIATASGKNKTSTRETVTEEGDTRAGAAVAPRTASVTATVSGQCSVRVEGRSVLGGRRAENLFRPKAMGRAESMEPEEVPCNRDHIA